MVTPGRPSTIVLPLPEGAAETVPLLGRRAVLPRAAGAAAAVKMRGLRVKWIPKKDARYEEFIDHLYGEWENEYADEIKEKGVQRISPWFV